jgi:Skp family chaperone for outer membrane proteins
VKRKVVFLAAIAALGVAVYVASQVWAQTSGRGQDKQLKIAVINLPLVIKKYKKYEVYEAELKKYVEAQQAVEEKSRATLMRLNTELQKQDPTGNEHDKLEEKIKDEKRKLEDLNMEFKKEFTKKQEQQLVTLYREVEEMVQRIAESNNISLVLQYGDVIDKKDAYNPRIIQHKVLGGVCMPMYSAPGMDISEYVYKYLNNAYAKKTGISNH